VGTKLASKANPSPKDFRDAQKGCDKQVLEDFEANGGDMEQFQLTKHEGSLDKLADSFQTCMKGLGLGPSTPPTKQQQKTCDNLAKTEFQKSGGDVEDFYVSKMDGAMNKLAKKMEDCVDALQLADGAMPNDTQLNTCETEAQSVFEEAGGDASSFMRAKQGAQETVLVDAMFACITSETETKSDPTRADFNAARKTCDAQSKVDFKKAGGKEEDFAIAKQKAAMDKMNDSRSACVKGLDLADGVKATKQQKKTCDNGAKKTFQQAGGDGDDFELQMEKGATSKLGSKMEACIRALDLADNVDPTLVQLQGCEGKAKTAFEEAGGDPERFDRAKKEGQEEAIADTMFACVVNQLKGKVTPSEAEFVAAAAACDTKAKEAFLNAGGNQEDFVIAKQEAAVEKVGDAQRACIKGLNLSNGVKATKQQQKTCKDGAKKVFQEVGGDAADFELEMKKGATNKLGSKMEACIGALDLADDVDPTLVELQGCEGKAKTAFEEAGGDPEKFDRAKKEGQEKVVGDFMFTCINKQLASVAVPTEDAFLTARRSCDTEAKKAYENAGGNQEDFEVAKQEAAVVKVGDSKRACTKALNLANGVKATKQQQKTCNDGAKKVFQESGGDADEFEIAKLEATVDVLESKMEACLGSLDLADNAFPSPSQLQTCSGEAQVSFVEMGGDVAEFEVAKKDSQISRCGDAMQACVEKNLAAKATPTEADFTSAQRSCNSKTKKDFEKGGGNKKDFEKVKAKAAVKKVTTARRACIKALNLAAGTKPTKVQRKACRKEAKKSFQEAGGNSDAFARKSEEANALNTATVFKTCIGALDLDSGVKANAAQKTDCKGKAKEAFEETNGDANEFAITKIKGARQSAVKAFSVCLEAAGDSPTAQEKTDCTTKAETTFEESGGDKAIFKREKEAGARNEMFRQMEVCVDAAVMDLDLPANTQPTKAQLDTAVSGCKTRAQETFVASGGDQVQFAAEQQKGQALVVGKELNACMKAGSSKTDCKTQAEALVKKMGGNVQRLERLEQDGVRFEVTSLLEACMTDAADGTGKAACNAAAKDKFKELSGKDDTAFAQETRRGAGEKAGDTQKACMADATGGAAQDACEVDAKKAHENAGGDKLDFWADQKQGALENALNNYIACKKGDTDEACTVKAKTYFTGVLKANEADWNDADFKDAKTFKDVVVTKTPSKKVDMRFKFTKKANEGLADAAALTTAKAKIQTALKDAASVTEVPECSDGADAGTKVQIVCRLTAPTTEEASAIQEKARSGEYTSAVTGTLSVSRRALRALAIDGTTDASVAQATEGTTTTPPTASPTQAPVDDDATAVAGNFGVASTPTVISWMAVAFAVAMQFV